MAQGWMRSSLVLTLLAAADPALAADGVDGRALGILWAAPFVGLLLSIAILPLWLPGVWHRHYGKIVALWGLAFAAPYAAVAGAGAAGDTLLHMAALEYMPFLILIFALFSVTGHIHISGNLHGSPRLNTAILALGTIFASIAGTTGASMLLIRPLVRANDDRKHNAHVVVFFIFLVANIGGSLTPLGDPPLFLGFLQGVDFFWTTRHLLAPTFAASALLLAVFFALDAYLYRREGRVRPDPTPDRAIRIDGKFNLVLLGAILVIVAASGALDLGRVTIAGLVLEWRNLARDGLLLAIAAASFALTAEETRRKNEFDFAPVVEVAKIFAAIFVTIIPVIAILQAGRSGALAGIVDLVTDPAGRPVNAMYFWLTGALSSFLDNAPTYLIFFNTAGGDAQQLMGDLARTLAAISAGAVYMGANSYIGNAPNMMVRSIAEARGVRMPGFFGYMAWSVCILLPIFGLLTILFFH